MSLGKILTGLALVALSAVPARASDHHSTHPVPGLRQGHLVSVPPGMRAQVTATFEADNENCVQIYEHGTGRMVQVWNNSEAGGGTWVSPQNTGPGAQLYLIVSRHKNTPSNVDEPWHLSPFRVLSRGARSVTVGWEDGVDDDFNDAVAVVSLVR